MTEENATVSNFTLSNSKDCGAFPRERLEFDIVTDIGELHFDSNDRSSRELNNIIARLFRNIDGSKVDLCTLFNELADKQLSITVDIVISQ